MLSLKARWVFPIISEPIRDGVVHIEDDRIVAVEPSRAGQGARDLGNVAILPGLINAHSHLELSGFDRPLGRPGISIVDWLGLVVEARRSADYDAEDAVRRGLGQSARAGVAAIGDIVQAEALSRNREASEACRHNQAISHSPAITAFLELIGPSESRAREALDGAAEFVGAGQGRGGERVGLSPHAPYSVCCELLEGACRLSRQHGLPVAFHLAESREEIQLLHDGAGPFRQLLQRLGAWDPAVQHPGRRSLHFLETLAAAERALVIHGNYLDDEEVAYLADRSETMSVVYCPRTHAWFQHGAYPLESMLAAGVTVALGTDSRASSPDLNLLEEMRAVAARHPAVPRATVVEMGTLAGAKALGLNAELGSLESGKLGRLAIVNLPERHGEDPYQLLLAPLQG